jgi:hypothetical protein
VHLAGQCLCVHQLLRLQAEFRALSIEHVTVQQRLEEAGNGNRVLTHSNNSLKLDIVKLSDELETAQRDHHDARASLQRTEAQLRMQADANGHLEKQARPRDTLRTSALSTPGSTVTCFSLYRQLALCLRPCLFALSHFTLPLPPSYCLVMRFAPRRLFVYLTHSRARIVCCLWIRACSCKRWRHKRVLWPP